MSLDETQRARTGVELRRHLHVAGVGMGQLAEWLRLPIGTVVHVMAMDGLAEAADVWLVRDALTQLVREAGAEAGGWSVLDDEARARAATTFHLRPLPERGTR